MTSELYIDPLEAAEELQSEILGNDGVPGNVETLMPAIDKFLYSLRFIFIDGVGYIEDTDLKAPRQDYNLVRQQLAERFPDLGNYWITLHHEVSKEGKLAYGDAIDDLADIVGEIAEVLWLKDNASRADALAGLRHRYDMHICNHVVPLRNYLESVKFFIVSEYDKNQFRQLL
jgi:hypothetical protein